MRLFIAVDPGEACRQRIAAVVGAVRATTSGVRWVRESQLHVTLAFFGEMDDLRVEDVGRRIRDAVSRHASFTALVAGAGVFPDWRRARVVWLGLGEGPLTMLGEDIHKACEDAGFPQDHAFRAHLTIGRMPRPLRPAERDALKAALSSLSASHPFEVERVMLMRSELAPSGSRYHEVASYPLARV